MTIDTKEFRKLADNYKSSESLYVSEEDMLRTLITYIDAHAEQIDSKARKEVADHCVRHIDQLKAKARGLESLLDLMTKQRDEALAAQQPSAELPKLPEPVYLGGDEAFGDVIKGHTDDAMREYGRLCRATRQPAQQPRKNKMTKEFYVGQENDWTENKGVCPVEGDVLVDVKIAGIRPPNHHDGSRADTWRWTFDEDDTDITHWRLHKTEHTVEEEFKGLENAYDEQEGAPMPAELFTPAINYMPGDKVIYKYPETSYVPPENIPVKRSKHSIAAEVYELITGKSLTEDDVSDIVNVLKLIEGMEK